MPFEPKLLATAIGSVPHPTAEAALDLILANIPEAPIWPQLSARGLLEQMEIQYAEGMPRVVIDEEKGRMYFDTSGEYWDDLAVFYETYMLAMDPDDGDGDCAALAISPAHSAGLYALEARLLARQAAGAGPLPFVKVQTTGPCSFSLTITDENKRLLYYNEEFRDVIVKALAMKARWQIQRLKPFAERIIHFIDEPILSAYGSSTYVAVQRDDIIALLQEMITAIHAEGAIAGVHCCGNTEWSILVDAGVDLINFDAYGFGETIAMYPAHVRRHLEGGGSLAWGIVTTSPAVRDETAQSLATRFELMVDTLVEKSGVDRGLVLRQALVTPSCGTGSMSVPDAQRVFELTGQLSTLLRQRHGSLG
jgi:hypothetical protein